MNYWQEQEYNIEDDSNIKNNNWELAEPKIEYPSPNDIKWINTF